MHRPSGLGGAPQTSPGTQPVSPDDEHPEAAGGVETKGGTPRAAAALVPGAVVGPRRPASWNPRAGRPRPLRRWSPVVGPRRPARRRENQGRDASGGCGDGPFWVSGQCAS